MPQQAPVCLLIDKFVLAVLNPRSSQDKGNESVNNTANDEPRKLTDKNIPATPTAAPAAEEIKHMETHAHHLHHAPGKKFWHYVYEFLMLFLAVFCGFLAENQREHMVEVHREKQYMQSMLADLKADTAEINRQITLIDQSLNPVFEKSTALLYSGNFSDSAVRAMYENVPKATRFLTIAFQDNTATQLKNSGNLRLIRDKQITDSLASYWATWEYLIHTQLESYEVTRVKSKELVFALFNLNYFERNSLTEPLRKNVSLSLMSNDRKELTTLSNHLSNLHGQTVMRPGSISHRLQTIHRKASNLIQMIQNEYWLK